MVCLPVCLYFAPSTFCPNPCRLRGSEDKGCNKRCSKMKKKCMRIIYFAFIKGNTWKTFQPHRLDSPHRLERTKVSALSQRCLLLPGQHHIMRRWRTHLMATHTLRGIKWKCLSRFFQLKLMETTSSRLLGSVEVGKGEARKAPASSSGWKETRLSKGTVWQARAPVRTFELSTGNVADGSRVKDRDLSGRC
jgi:hypothetical protein